MLYLGYPSSVPQQLLKLSWWVQHPGCRTCQRTRPPGFLFRKLGAERGRSKQLQPGFLPWRMRAGRFFEPCPERGERPPWPDTKAQSAARIGAAWEWSPPLRASSGGRAAARSRQSWKNSGWFLPPSSPFPSSAVRQTEPREEARVGLCRRKRESIILGATFFANPRQSTTRQREDQEHSSCHPRSLESRIPGKKQIVFFCGKPGKSPLPGSSRSTPSALCSSTKNRENVKQQFRLLLLISASLKRGKVDTPACCDALFIKHCSDSIYVTVLHGRGQHRAVGSECGC